MGKFIWFFGLTAVLASCSVQREDLCKVSNPAACPGLLGAPEGMSIVDLTPASQSLSVLPTAVVAKFSEAAGVVETAKFVLTGTCVNLPTVNSVTMSADNITATANLSAGLCLNNQTLIVTVTPASLTNIDGEAGVGAAVSRTYTMISLGPTATLASPSATALRSVDSATIALTYTGATTTTLDNAGITKNEVGTSCTVSVSGASAAGATLNVSNCSGNGTLTVFVNAGTAQDASGNLSSASPVSAVIHVDNTGPSLTALTPATGTMVANPTTIVATFNEKMTALSAGNFVLGGNCTTTPAVSGVTMSSDGTIATATLSGGTCSHGQNLTVTLTPATLADAVGNAGLGGVETRTYSINTAGPTAVLAAPSVTRMNAGGTSTVALTYNGAVATTLTASGVTKNQAGTNCNVSVTNTTAAGATLTISGCTGNGTISVVVDANTATNSLGNGSTASAPSATITIDNTSPTLSSLTPVSGNFATMPTQVVATFSEAMTVLDSSKFTLSGSCSTLPTKGSVTMSNGNTVASLGLSGGTCALGETLTATVNPITVTDTAGNIGVGSATAVTYTKINGVVNLNISGSSSLDVSCNEASYIPYYVQNAGSASAVITGTSIPGTSGAYLVADNCNGQTLTPGASCVIYYTFPAGQPGSNTLTIDYDDSGTPQTKTYVIEVKDNGC